MSENYSNKYKGVEYKINIDNKEYQKVQHWIDKAPGEVSGLGKLVIDPNTGLIEVKKAIILKQENTGNSTDIDANDITKAMFELRNEPGSLNWWWHSHVDFGVFWSITDMTTIRQIGEQGFVVATVFNKKREMLSAIYHKNNNPMFPETFIDNVDTHIMDYFNPEVVEEWNKEYNEKCTVKTYTHSTYTPNSEGYSMYDEGYWEEREDWYKNWQHTDHKRKEQFDFDDYGQVPSSNDEAKAMAIKPQLDVLKEEMLKQDTYGHARRFLNIICNRVNKAKFLDKDKSFDLKQLYIKVFNEKYQITSKQTKELESEKEKVTNENN